LIVRYGAPKFVKIDCEGSEAAILAGLTQPVPALSFEFLPWTLEEADACVARLEKIGPYEFNWSKGETNRLASERWLNETEVLAALRTPEAQRRAGDVYARLARSRVEARSYDRALQRTSPVLCLPCVREGRPLRVTRTRSRALCGARCETARTPSASSCP
jgi:hypothetical protein